MKTFFRKSDTQTAAARRRKSIRAITPISLLSIIVILLKNGFVLSHFSTVSLLNLYASRDALKILASTYIYMPLGLEMKR